MTEQQAMRMALEALESGDGWRQSEAITALRQALGLSEGGDCDSPSWCKQYKKCHRKVVGSPTLANCTDEQQPSDEPWEKFCDSNCVWTDHHPDCKLAKDEPVAMNWSVFNTGAEVWDKLSLADAVVELTPARLERGWSAVCVINKDNPPLYARPQPAAWVGLDDADLANCDDEESNTARYWEAKLKEKNT